jgi:hypothetical protein
VGGLPASVEDIVCAPEYAWDCATALAITWCESRDVPTATSAGGHRGIWQLYDGHAWRFERRGWTWDDAYDQERATVIAYEIWLVAGWTPWSCRP